MHRFFLPAGSLQHSLVIFPEETAHQIARVLRLKPGSIVAVLDNSGREAQVELEQVAAHAVSGRILQIDPVTSELPIALSLYICLTQREKFELILQKCTELGAQRIIPVISSRSLVQSSDDVEKKRTRWSSIVREAAEQCGGGRIPEILPAQSYAAALENGTARHAQTLILWEEEHSLRLRAAFKPETTSLALLIGPEGGLSAVEVENARMAGWLAVSLGKRILRMETAAIAAATLVADFYAV